MKTYTADFIVIGGGIIGLSIARCLKKMYGPVKIAVLEKETHCGLHASGRNSGVLHAGFYYTPDSLKAKFTRLGNAALTEYCEKKKIPLHQCGKLVVAKDEQDLAALDELFKRGKNNGVLLENITDQEAKKIEPRVITYERALFSPTTSSVDPKEVLQALEEDAKAEGIDIYHQTQFVKRKQGNAILTTKGLYEANYIVNAAGLYADKIAKEFNFSKDYHILPFKGLYLYSQEPPYAFKTHIYPVPDLKNPFLGVHFTITSTGKVKIGPTAIPVLWREQYGRFAGFKWDELIDILWRQTGLFFSSQFDFKKLALEEIKKYSPSYLIRLAARLATGIKKENFKYFAPPGIRAQLLNTKKRQLEMDFILEGDHASMHVLNAVSPAFTSSFPFSQYVCDQIKLRIGA